MVALAGVDLDVARRRGRSACSARPGRASPRCSTCSPGCCGPAPAGCRSARTTSRGWTRRGWPGCEPPTSGSCCRARCATCCPTPTRSTTCASPSGRAQGAPRRAATTRLDLPEPHEVLDLVGLADHAPTSLDAALPRRAAAARGRRRAGRAARACCCSTSRPASSTTRAATRSSRRSRRSTATSAPRSSRSPTTPRSASGCGRTVTIRDGRVGAEGRRGEEFAVVGRDGSVQLPPDVLERVPPGSLLRVTIVDESAVRLDRTERTRPDRGGRRMTAETASCRRCASR